MHIASIESICFPRLLSLVVAAKQAVSRSSASVLHRLHVGRPVSHLGNSGWSPHIGGGDVEVAIVVLTAHNI